MATGLLLEVNWLQLRRLTVYVYGSFAQPSDPARHQLLQRLDIRQSFGLLPWLGCLNLLLWPLRSREQLSWLKGLRSKKGKEDIARRKTIVEPVFGQITEARARRRFMVDWPTLLTLSRFMTPPPEGSTKGPGADLVQLV
jgi:hypothetical protein